VGEGRSVALAAAEVAAVVAMAMAVRVVEARQAETEVIVAEI